MIHAVQRLSLFSLQPVLGAGVAGSLGVPLAAHEARDFEDGEHKTRPLESVRDRDVYLLASLYGDGEHNVNDRLVRTLFFLGTLRDAGAARLTAVLPYLCYARKDRRTKSRDPVATRYVAALFEGVGIDRVLTVDVHNPAAYENAFRVRTEHLSAAQVLVERLAARLGPGEPVVISPDVGGIKRAEIFRALLSRRLGVGVDRGFMDKRRSSGIVSGDRLVADVKGREVVLVDDLVSSGGTLVRAAAACRAAGAGRVLAAATHGVFSAQTEKLLADSALDGLLISDSVPVPRPGSPFSWSGLETVSIVALLAEAVRRLHEGGSLVALGGPDDPGLPGTPGQQTPVTASG